MADVYEKLRARLDDMATGYPETESKVEIKLLKKIFTEAEAKLFLQLMPFLQKPEDVAKQLDRDIDEIAAMMEQMAKKGLLRNVKVVEKTTESGCCGAKQLFCEGGR
jgi:hypothetical protein